MMLDFTFQTTDLAIFLAILLRISVVLFMVPIFSSPELPRTIKAFTTVGFAAVLYLPLHSEVAPISFEPSQLIVTVVGEILFGILFSLSFLLILGAFQFSGELVSFQMGFGLAQAVDPQSGVQVMLLSRLYQIIAVMLFFGVNAHHLVIKALVESFRLVPLGGLVLKPQTAQQVIHLSSQLFVIAMKIAAPILVVLFATYLGMGFMAKFAPEIHILVVSFPLTIIIGFLMLTLTIPLWVGALQSYLALFFQFLRPLMGGLAAGP